MNDRDNLVYYIAPPPKPDRLSHKGQSTLPKKPIEPPKKRSNFPKKPIAPPHVPIPLSNRIGDRKAIAFPLMDERSASPSEAKRMDLNLLHS